MNQITIDPLVDFACHLLLGSPDHPQVTIHFLNAILKPSVPITRVQILNPIVGKEFDGDKLSILDILATDALGRMFNIEVQRSVKTGLSKRLVYYVSTQFIMQIGEGDGYELLRPSIGICILDAVLFPDSPVLHHEFQLRSQVGLPLTDCLQIHLLELPKYVANSDNKSSRDAEIQWIHFLRTAYGANPADLLEELPDPVFAEAVGILEMIQRSPDERRLYEARLKFQRDEKAQLDYAREEGEARGHIFAFQKVLGLPASPRELIDAMTLDDLQQMLSELQQKVSEKFSKD